MKRVLLCAFYFAPRNNIASYRTGCFAKYLPENGWLPTVLCQDWPLGSPEYDPDFVGTLPEAVRVIRIPMPKLAGPYQRLWLRKLLPYARADLVPIVWWQQSRTKLQSLIQRTRFDVTWGTSDPMAPLALAREASRLLSVPWVADLRDSFNVQRFGSWYKRPFFAYQERRLCRAANAVTTVSSGLAEIISKRADRPVQVIHNGFDPSLFGNKPVPERSVFRLVYAGKLVWPRQNPLPLFEAVDLCLRSGRIPAGELELAFYGADLDAFRRARPGVLEALPVKSYPRVPHHDMIRVLQSNPVLLLFAHAHERGVLTGKLFDYLGAGQAILAVPDDQGDVAALLRKTGAGVSLNQREEIANQLTSWYRTWKQGNPLVVDRREDLIARYSRREQAKELAALLDSLVGDEKAAC
jgi:glycosyltransferase involved in cell wall biosynthesis